MTPEEYATLKREAFKDGVKHAQGFMAIPNAELCGGTSATNAQLDDGEHT